MAIPKVEEQDILNALKYIDLACKGGAVFEVFSDYNGNNDHFRL